MGSMFDTHFSILMHFMVNKLWTGSTCQTVVNSYSLTSLSVLCYYFFSLNQTSSCSNWTDQLVWSSSQNIGHNYKCAYIYFCICNYAYLHWSVNVQKRLMVRLFFAPYIEHFVLTKISQRMLNINRKCHLFKSMC